MPRAFSLPPTHREQFWADANVAARRRFRYLRRDLIISRRLLPPVRISSRTKIIWHGRLGRTYVLHGVLDKYLHGRTNTCYRATPTPLTPSYINPHACTQTFRVASRDRLRSPRLQSCALDNFNARMSTPSHLLPNLWLHASFLPPHCWPISPSQQRRAGRLITKHVGGGHRAGGSGPGVRGAAGALHASLRHPNLPRQLRLQFSLPILLATAAFHTACLCLSPHHHTCTRGSTFCANRHTPHAGLRLFSRHYCGTRRCLLPGLLAWRRLGKEGEGGQGREEETAGRHGKSGRGSRRWEGAGGNARRGRGRHCYNMTAGVPGDMLPFLPP